MGVPLINRECQLDNEGQRDEKSSRQTTGVPVMNGGYNVVNREVCRLWCFWSKKHTIMLSLMPLGNSLLITQSICSIYTVWVIFSFVLSFALGPNYDHVYFCKSKWFRSTRMPVCTKSSHHSFSTTEKCCNAQTSFKQIQRQWNCNYIFPVWVFPQIIHPIYFIHLILHG